MENLKSCSCKLRVWNWEQNQQSFPLTDQESCVQNEHGVWTGLTPGTSDMQPVMCCCLAPGQVIHSAVFPLLQCKSLVKQTLGFSHTGEQWDCSSVEVIRIRWRDVEIFSHATVFKDIQSYYGSEGRLLPHGLGHVAPSLLCYLRLLFSFHMSRRTTEHLSRPRPDRPWAAAVRDMEDSDITGWGDSSSSIKPVQFEFWWRSFRCLQLQINVSCFKLWSNWNVTQGSVTDSASLRESEVFSF